MDTSNQKCGDKQEESEVVAVSKKAQKRLLKQKRYQVKKAQKKEFAKEQKLKEAERKKKEWLEKLDACKNEEERTLLIESRKALRKERMEQRASHKDMKLQRLNNAKQKGLKIVLDLDFSPLMNASQISSLSQQIMYCYAVNGRCTTPAHLWLTGCLGETHNQLQRLPGFDKWVIEKESRSYIESFQDQKENLVYLTADSETTVDELDHTKVYIIGGLVDRNRFKGITQNKAKEQGIQTAKLPIGNFLKMSSSQVAPFS
ncbi:hypothetical protein Leryth_027350 [Lithospermum erythrorhizon]|nr:hypothetical protein Leryth_027350 [Lithospermum erythrorhizon]